MTDNQEKVVGLVKTKPTLKKWLFICAGLFIIIGLLLLGSYLSSQAKHRRDIKLTKQADSYGLAGDYRKKIPVSIQLFRDATSDAARADLANQISVNYYSLNDIPNGRKWVQTAADYYKKAGDNDSATLVLEEAKSTEAQINHPTVLPASAQDQAGPTSDL